MFFGSFRRAEKCGSAVRFVKSAPKLHVVFGWLEVGEVRPVTDALAIEIPWAKRHPHLSEPARYKSNTLYLASKRLSSLDLQSPGGGIFDQLRPELILTETDPYSGCATWMLPRWIHPRTRTPLSYHSRANRWTDREGSVRLQSAYPGQEFVLDLDEYPEAYDWLRGIFGRSEAGRASASRATSGPKSVQF